MEELFTNMSGLDHEPIPKEIDHIFLDNEMRVVGPPLKIESLFQK